MSGHDSSPLRPEDEDLLQAALSDPFSVSNIRRLSPSQPTESALPSTDSTASTSTSVPAPAAATVSSSSFMSTTSVSTEEKEAWKVQHEAQVAEWRRDSAAVRARAEVERARWEERRAHERQVAATLSGGQSGGVNSSVTSEWEAVSSSSQRSTSAIASAASPFSLAASGESSFGPGSVGGGGGGGVSGQVQSGATLSKVPPPPPPPQRQGQAAQSNVPGSTTTTSGTHQSRSALSAAAGTAGTEPIDSPHWENVPSSIASSFPSLSFPEPSRPHSPEHPHSHVAPPDAAAPTTRPVTAASMTLAVFDDTLPVRSRFLALLSSLSINFFLPFVNGVMLGFGEIFAKTVIVRWFGWGPAVATNVGLGQSGHSRRNWWGGKSV